MESSLNPSMHPTSGIEKGSSDGTVTIQPARDNNCNGSDMKHVSGPGTVSIVSMGNDPKEGTERSKEKEESEDTDKKDMRLDSPESVEDTPDDEGSEEDDEKSTRPE